MRFKNILGLKQQYQIIVKLFNKEYIFKNRFINGVFNFAYII